MTRLGTSMMDTYFRCEVCGRNFEATPLKHFYSAIHQRRLSAVMLKMKLKIKRAVTTLKEPQIRRFAADENVQKIWCWPCQKELPRDINMHKHIIQHSGFLKHLARAEHHMQVDLFCANNHIDHKTKDSLKLSLCTVESFNVKCEIRMQQLDQAESDERSKESQKLYQQDIHRECTISQSPNERTIPKSPRERVMDGSSTTVHDGASHIREPLQRVRTIGAVADGLTCITLPKFDNKSGNIHTGASPPWLQNNIDETRAEIGPTSEDYRKHLSQVRTKALPACRVGAEFNHDETTDSDWMPSFAQVWGKKRTHDKSSKNKATVTFQSSGSDQNVRYQQNDDSNEDGESNVKHTTQNMDVGNSHTKYGGYSSQQWSSISHPMGQDHDMAHEQKLVGAPDHHRDPDVGYVRRNQHIPRTHQNTPSVQRNGASRIVINQKFL